MPEVFTIQTAGEYARICLIVCPLVFFAGFIDSIAGGGGIISLPAYLIAGFPSHFAAATNKFVSGIGTAVSAWKYKRSGKLIVSVALLSAAGAFIGSSLGTRLALYLREEVLRIVIVSALPLVALFLLTRKDFGKENKAPRALSPAAQAAASVAIGLVIGCYDGLIGPGTGTFLILAFTGVLGIDLLMSSGCAKVSNLASNLASMIIYMINGKTVYLVALPAAVFSMAGHYMGARYAIRGGSKNIRKMLFVVLSLLFIKLIADFFMR